MSRTARAISPPGRIARIYRGGEGELAWALHRLSGLGVLFFLFLHILDTSLVLLGKEAYETFIGLYRTPVLRVLEVVLAMAVLYHAGNGVRITIYDFWPKLLRFDRFVFYLGVFIYPAVVIPMAYMMLRPVFFPTLPPLFGG